jgi:hypothetical protein
VRGVRIVSVTDKELDAIVAFVSRNVGVTDKECHADATFTWRNAPPRKCRRCGREILDSEAAVRLRGELLACPDCEPAAAKYATPCDACGRKVARHRFCNWHCRAHYYNAPAAARRKAQRRKAREGMVCTECAKTFTATRADQKWCSPACKQKAYRERNRVVG